MANDHIGRRQFLVALAGSALLPRVVPHYDPAAKFDITVSEVEFRRSSAGRMLMARAYRPTGAGPFPTVLDLHGGAWTPKIGAQKNQWTARWRRAGCWSSRSI